MIFPEIELPSITLIIRINNINNIFSYQNIFKLTYSVSQKIPPPGYLNFLFFSQTVKNF